MRITREVVLARGLHPEEFADRRRQTDQEGKRQAGELQETELAVQFKLFQSWIDNESNVSPITIPPSPKRG